MIVQDQPAKRGRPRTITPERIVEAGIKMGLRHITFVGVAAGLGVSHMALYKHVENLAQLKQMVAEAVFDRWQLPTVSPEAYPSLESYLLVFMNSARALVKTYPGIAPYLLRRAVATPAMRAKIDAHQELVAQTFGIPKRAARWMLSTVAFHCIAVADTLYCAIADEKEQALQSEADVAEMEAEFELGMKMLIKGALVHL